MMRARDAGWLAAGGASALLVQLLPGSVAFFDAGELATAAATLGVPHPTGFPALNLAGHACATLLPLGDRAFRIHLVSLLCAVAATTLALSTLWRVATRSSPTPLTLAAGSLFVLAAPTMLLHASAVEVYALVWLMVAGCSATLAGRRLRPAAAYPLVGAAALIHVEAGLFAVLSGAVGLWTSRDRWAGRRLGGGVLGVIAALGLLYLPLASLRAPYLDWGVVRSPAALWDHLTAASIRSAFSSEIGGGPEAFTLLGRLVWREVGLGLLAALVGLGMLARRRRMAALWALAITMVDLAYAGLINPMGLMDDQVGQVAIGTLRCLAALGVAGGAWHAWRRLGASAGRVPIAGLAASLLALSAWWPVSSAAPRTHPLIDARGRAAAADVADLWLDGVAPGALLVASGDQRASACLWLQGAAGRRPDVRCLPGVFARDPALLDGLATHWRSASLGDAVAKWRAARLGERAWTDAWLDAAAAEGPVATSPGLRELDRRTSARTNHALPWSALAEQTATEPAAQPAAGSAERGATATLAAMRSWIVARFGPPPTHPACTPGAPFAELLGIELGVVGTGWLRTEPAAGRAALHLAAALAPRTPRVLHNLAVVALADGETAQALALATGALDEDPTYRRAHRVAARAAARAGDTERGLEHALSWSKRASPAAAHTFLQQWLEGDVPADRRDDVARALTLAGAWSPTSAPR